MQLPRTSIQAVRKASCFLPACNGSKYMMSTAFLRQPNYHQHLLNGNNKPQSSIQAQIRHTTFYNQESFDQFTKRFVDFFNNQADDLFELSRGLNNALSYDLVPAPEVFIAAFKACRRLGCFTMTVRILEGLKWKVDDDAKYKEYIQELKPIMDELGIPELGELQIENLKFPPSFSS